MPLSLHNAIKTFVPTWFTVIMGTGNVAGLWTAIPYGKKDRTIRAFAAIYLILNMVLFVTFTGMTIARHIMFPKIWSAMLKTPVSIHLAAIPTGLTTIINGCVILFYTYYGWGGKHFIYTLWGFWWVVVILSGVSLWALFYLAATRQKHTLEHFSLGLVFPALPAIVGSGTGAILAVPLAKYNLNYAMITHIVSFLMVIMGLSFALIIITIFTAKLIVYGPPKGMHAMAAFLALGPCGQSGFAILLMGQNFKKLLPLHYGNSGFLHNAAVPDILNAICITIGMVLWAFGLMWFLMGMFTIVWAFRNGGVPFQLAYWALVFPVGVYAYLSIQLGNELDSHFFKIFGQTVAIGVIVTWFYVGFMTVGGVISGSLFDPAMLAPPPVSEKVLADVESTAAPSPSTSRDHVNMDHSRDPSIRKNLP